MTDKTRRLLGLAAAFFVLCLAFAAMKITLEEAVAETTAGPTICYECSSVTRENPIPDCNEYEDESKGSTICILTNKRCRQSGKSCE